MRVLRRDGFLTRFSFVKRTARTESRDRGGSIQINQILGIHAHNFLKCHNCRGSGLFKVLGKCEEPYLVPVRLIGLNPVGDREDLLKEYWFIIPDEQTFGFLKGWGFGYIEPYSGPVER